MTAPISYRRSFWHTQPEYSVPAYRSTQKRAPTQPLVVAAQTLSEITGPVFAPADVAAEEADLTRHPLGEPLGERIIVSGRVLDDNGRPQPDVLIEIWQANAAGRYRHVMDRHEAPLDPHFTGAGRVVTDADGRYRFKTIKPGAYPWRNHHNAWRPAHIHLSLFGRALVQRLVTQFYFPGDPLLAYDPIFLGVPDARAQARLVAELDWEQTVPEYALAYRFDIVLRGQEATSAERPR